MSSARDSDISLWLHNKLGTSSDMWSGKSICPLLNIDVLRKVADCFFVLQSQVKIKLLLSFLHLPKRHIEEWRHMLEEILAIACTDSDQWVSTLAEIMKTFPSTGNLNTNVETTEANKHIWDNVVQDLRKSVDSSSDLNFLPLECSYLNESALNAAGGKQVEPVKHFTLRREPKAAQLRAELLRKCAEAKSNVKKCPVPTVPVRSRGIPRKMADTTPLRGISNTGTSSGFHSSAIASVLPKPLAGAREGGIKLLDISEQPLSSAQARKRKRQQELEATTKAKESQKESVVEAVLPPPDYMAGLFLNHPVLPASLSTFFPPEPPYFATSDVHQKVPTPATGNISTSYQPRTYNIAERPLSLVIRKPNPSVQNVEDVIIPTCKPESPEIRNVSRLGCTNASVSPTVVESSLQLTHDQVQEVQDIFRTANCLSSTEKTFITNFIAGSRVNPLPHLGNMFNIKISEHEIQCADGSKNNMICEVYFQMNYTTGERKLTKKFHQAGAVAAK